MKNSNDKKGLGDAAQSSGPGYPLQSSAEDGERISASIPIAEIYRSLITAAHGLLLMRLSECPDDWNFRLTTGKRDRAMVVAKVESQNERVRRSVIDLVAIGDLLLAHDRTAKAEQDKLYEMTDCLLHVVSACKSGTMDLNMARQVEYAEETLRSVRRVGSNRVEIIARTRP